MSNPNLLRDWGCTLLSELFHVSFLLFHFGWISHPLIIHSFSTEKNLLFLSKKDYCLIHTQSRNISGSDYHIIDLCNHLINLSEHIRIPSSEFIKTFTFLNNMIVIIMNISGHQKWDLWMCRVPSLLRPHRTLNVKAKKGKNRKKKITKYFFLLKPKGIYRVPKFCLAGI